MDLYRIDSSLRKGYPDKSSPFARTDAAQSGSRNDLAKFSSNDILSSSSWSSVIHQPAQDSEPEDLPSTVDIDAIKQPPTPVNASAQTPARQLHGDSTSFELSDDQNVADSGSESDSDSESGNSENEVENTASGVESGSSESDSVSSRRSSSSSKDKPASSRSSRSNSPPSNGEDKQRFSVTNQGGLKMKLSSVSKYGHGTYDYNENSSDSSESKDSHTKEEIKYATKPILPRKRYPLGPREDQRVKNTSYKFAASSKAKRFEVAEAEFDDSDSSSSSLSSPTKHFASVKNKSYDVGRSGMKAEPSASRFKSTTESDRSYSRSKEEKYEKVVNACINRKKEVKRNMYKERPPQLSATHGKYRVGQSMFSPPVLKLPGTCKLSEDSDDSEDVPRNASKNEPKKENNRDTLEKLAQQFTRPGNLAEHLQVLNDEDLAAVFPDDSRLGSANVEREVDTLSGRKKATSVYDHKKISALSDSSSDAEMLPKQNQIVSDAINSIHVDSDESDDSRDSSTRHDSSDESSSSEDEKGKPKEKVQYSSNLLEAFAEKTEQLSKHNIRNKLDAKNSIGMPSSAAKLSVDTKIDSNESFRKRGRPPKSRMSSMAEIESYMKLGCSASNVSPDSGIQSNSGSPLYGVQSPARSVSGNNKKSATSTNAKSLSLSQKALLGASRKNSQKKKETSEPPEVLKNQTNQLPKSAKPEIVKKVPGISKELVPSVKTAKSTVESDELDDLIKVPPYLGAKNHTSTVSQSVATDSSLLHGKRGPGRPKKPVLNKVNGKTNFDKAFPAKIDNQFHKSFNLATKPMFTSRAKSKKQKYRSPVVMCLENPKKRRKKKTDSSNLTYRNRENPVSSTNFRGVNNKWSKKRKKHKKKSSKEKVVSPEFLKELESLAELFNKKCVIEDKKAVVKVSAPSTQTELNRSKPQHRSKERNCKKRKQSDRDSESETNSVVTAPVNDTKVKRRTKKSAVEAPKLPQNNCDQRLPLKKRQYHISTPSNANNSHHHHHHHHHHHQLPAKTKIRNEADVPKSGIKSPDVTKVRPPLSPKPKNTSSAPALVPAASTAPATLTLTDADKPPILEEFKSTSKDADTVTKSASTAPPLPSTSSETPTSSTIVGKLQTSSTSNQPQLITPLPSESTTSSTLSTSSKPPAGVFEPTRKLPTSAKGKKNSIDDVLSKLKEKLKDLESPLKNTNALIEKIGGSRKETTESVALPEQRVLRSKRSSSEKDLLIAKKNKLTATVSVRLHKLSNSELISSGNSNVPGDTVPAIIEAPKEELVQSEKSADVESPSTPATIDITTAETTPVAIKDDEKPKLKRRKTRNRTGFPVKKKRKLKRETPMPAETFGGDVQVKVEESNVTETDAAETTLEDDCPPIVKDETASPPAQNDDWSDDDIPLARRLAPVLQPIVTTSAPSKTEISEPDPVKSVDEVKVAKSVSRKTSTTTTMPVIATATEKSKTDNSCFRTLPSRASVRIHCKKQIQEEEEEAAKKEAEKKNAAVAKKPAAKEKEPTEKRELRPQKPTSVTDKKPPVLKKEEPKKVTGKKETKGEGSAEVETKADGDAEKESKPKEETDKEEMSDDSAKQSTAKKDAIPKRRKKFLHAGLFSDFYKEEKQPVVDWKCRFAPFKPKEHPHGLLPPPPYFEDWVRRRQVDFALPYDLWWLDKHEQLPGRAVVESWKYKKIMKNTYNEVKPTNIYETQACNCEFPKEEGKLGCGDDCINRLVYTECSPAVCPLKERCANQRIQKNSGDKKLVRYMTAEKGIGVKTEKPIKTGEYILEYVGEVVTDKEFKKRMTSLYKNDIHHYCLNLDGGLVIDGHRSGSDGRFVNHSCEPNCEMQKWSVDGYYRMALFALRDIEPGEEITYDYNFALFNPAEGQPCRCGSTNCRGVIGGKSQRISLPNANNTAAGDSSSSANGGAPGSANNGSKKKSRMRPRKQVRKDNGPLGSGESGPNKRRRDSEGSNGMNMLPLRSLQLMIPLKPLSPEEVQVVKDYRIFLQRSLKKVQRIREKFLKENSENPNEDASKMKSARSKQSTEFLVQLNALSKQRFIRTRGLAQVDDNPEMTKTLQLAKIFRSMYNEMVSAKDERDEKNKPYSSFFLTLPSKRKLPTYYTRVEEPIDLTAIEKGIITGVYKDIESFDADMNKLITNNVAFYGRISEYGIAAVNLRKAYNIAKLKYAAELQELLGHSLPATFMPEQKDPGDEEEDVIRCICGLFNDEGLMIQCERCLVWQHCDCVRADTNVEDYLCERCNPRDVDYDIPLDVAPPDYPKPDEKHYLTLMRDELQIRQGDAVYVLRSIPNPETGEPHTFRTIKTFKFEDCDIFRVEQLWKTNEGQRFSFGHHYLRPHETFHEPTRKFYPNEVLKVPLYETVPLDLIMGRCHVLDPNTYCKGKPIDADPQHVYICEFRVDKEAKLFYKIPRSKQLPVCMKNYAFEKYDMRLKPSRTYAPHGDPKPTIASNNMAANATTSKSTSSQKTKFTKSKENATTNHQKPSKSKESISNPADANRLTDPVKTEEPEILVVKDPKVEKQKQRLNSLLLKLLAKKSTKGALDASYLLDMGRRNRKKPAQQPRPATPTQN